MLNLFCYFLGAVGIQTMDMSINQIPTVMGGKRELRILFIYRSSGHLNNTLCDFQMAIIGEWELINSRCRGDLNNE